MYIIEVVAYHIRNLLRRDFNGLYVTGYVRNKEYRELVIISKSKLPEMEAVIDFQYNARKITSDDNTWTEYEIHCNGDIDNIVYLRLHTYTDKNERQEIINYYKK